MIDIEAYLKDNQIEYKTAPDDELNLRICPFCGDERWKFYINNQTGLYWCHLVECEQRGSWYKFLRQTGGTLPVRSAVNTADQEAELRTRLEKEEEALDTAHGWVFKDENAIKFFTDKRIDPDTVKQFKIGVKKDKNGTAWLSFPYFSNGKLKNCKYRTITGKRRFKRLVGGASVLYNEDYVRTPAHKRVLITEGETDCLSAYSNGIRWAVGVTVGAKSINHEWIDQLDRFERIYICFDTDIDGRRGAHKLAKRLGEERCYNVVLPIGSKDLNDYFKQGHTKEEFYAILNTARPFEVEGVVPLRDTLRQVAEEFKLRGTLDTGIHLPYKELDKKMGGLLSGDLIVLSGIPGVGKTSFALNVAHHLVLHEGIPGLFICQEMRPERLARKLMCIHLEKSGRFLKEEDVMRCYNDFKDFPLFFGHMYKGLDIEKIKNTVRECVRRYGIEFLVFDHLHFLCRSINNITTEVGVVTREFKMLAEDEGIPIFLIVHPRKVIEGRVPTQNDLRDSGLIPADSDFILILHRNRKVGADERMEERFESSCLVRVEKARYEAGGDAYLEFEGEKSLFRE